MAREKLNYPEIKERITNMAAISLNVTDIAYVLGVRRETLSRYFKRYPELKHAYKVGKAKGAMKLKAKAFDLAQEGSENMIKYVLSNIGDWHDRPIQVDARRLTINQPVNIIGDGTIKEVIEQIREVYGPDRARLAQKIVTVLELPAPKDPPRD